MVVRIKWVKVTLKEPKEIKSQTNKDSGGSGIQDGNYFIRVSISYFPVNYKRNRISQIILFQ